MEAVKVDQNVRGARRGTGSLVKRVGRGGRGESRGCSSLRAAKWCVAGMVVAVATAAWTVLRGQIGGSAGPVDFSVVAVAVGVHGGEEGRGTAAPQARVRKMDDGRPWVVLPDVRAHPPRSSSTFKTVEEVWPVNEATQRTGPSEKLLHEFAAMEQRQKCFVDPECDAGAGGRRFVIAENAGGIGNQMLSTTSAFLLALVTKSAFLSSHDGLYGLEAFFDRPFSTSLDEFRLRLPRNASQVKVIHIDDNVKRNAPSSLSALEMLLCGQNDYPRTIVVKASQWWAELLMLNRRFAPAVAELFGDDVDSATVFHDLAALLWTPAKQLEKRLPAAETLADAVGVHIRKHHFDARVLDRQEQLFFDCAAAAVDGEQVAAAPGNLTLLYVATDDLKLRGWLHRTAGMTHGWKVLTVASAPQSKAIGGTDILGALIDLYSLARCKRLVLSSWSTFSYVAAALNRHATHSLVSSSPSFDRVEPEPSQVPQTVDTVEKLRYAGVPFLDSARTECVVTSVSPCFHHLGFADLTRLTCGSARLSTVRGLFHKVC